MADYKLLPFTQPPLLTYHNQACVGVVAMQRKSGMTWYLNNAMQLSLEKKFLSGYTTPKLLIEGAMYTDVSAIKYEKFNIKFAPNGIVEAIVGMLDCNHYVLFHHADDYYIEGKSWYGERHFRHDGMIIGYDMSDRTFTVVAYDKTWVFRSFRTPMGCFIEAFKGENDSLPAGNLVNMWPVTIEDKLDFKKIMLDLQKYLDSNFEKYPMKDDGKKVFGIITLKYLAEYFKRVLDGRIPYEKVDRRIFRLLLDHKALMHKRIVAVSNELNISTIYADDYKKLVDMLESMRFQYKKFELRPNMYIIERLIEQLHELYEKELVILAEFIEVMGEKLENRKDDNNGKSIVETN